MDNHANQHLLKIFRNKEAIIFCGAGISLEPPAGLPDWNKLRDYTLKAIASKDKVLRKFLESLFSTELHENGLVPEVVASEIIKSCSGYFEVFRALEEGQPNVNHQYLAILAKLGLLKYIVTTNFDVFIERALEQQNVTYNACSTLQQFEQFTMEAKDSVYVLKIHGCINEPSTITATVEQEAKGLSHAKKQVLKQLLQQYHVVFWGYSGADLKIDLDYLQMLSSQKTAKGFVWNFFESKDYKESINPYVEKLIEIYKERAFVVHGKLPEVFACFDEKKQVDHVKYTLQRQKAWIKKKNAKLQKSLNAWAKEYLSRENACFIFANLLCIAGKMDKALQCYQHTEKLHKGNREKLAVVYNGIGLIHDRKGLYDEALLYYQKQQQICLDFNNEQALANCLNNIGMVYKAMSDYVNALYFFEKAIKITRSLKNSKELATQLNNVGSLLNLKGQYDKALYYYEEVKEIDSTTGNKWGMASNLNNIGTVYHSLGDYDKAEENYYKAEQISNALGDIGELATSLNNIATIYNEKEDYCRALDFFKKAEQMYRSIDDQRGIADCLGNVGSVYEFLEKYDYALEYQLQALEIDRATSNYHGSAHRLNNIGGIYDLQNNFDAALEYYKEAEKIYRDLEDAEGLALSLNNIANIYHLYTDVEKACMYLGKALSIVEEIGHTALSALFSRNIGYIYENDLENCSEAVVYYEKSLEYYSIIGDQQEIRELREQIINCS